MADPIGPGDWVEVIRVERFHGIFAAGELVCVETVLGVAQCEGCGGACPGLHLHGKPTPRDLGLPHLAWAGCSFRPIYRRRDAEALTAKLLVGARAKGPLVPAQVEREGSRETVK